MAGGGDGETETVASLETTPTWAVAAVCVVLIAISFFIEQLIHLLSKVFSKRRKSLGKALHKVESELMLFGFISLLLSVSKEPISRICVPISVAETFLPCQDSELSSKIEEETHCRRQGNKLSLISAEGVNQLQRLIFVFAVFHVLCCVLTFGLGMAKMKRWQVWEEETRSLEYQVANDSRRFKLIKQTTFGHRHLKFWSPHRLLRWPVCFLRQFTGSVSKTDYFTLRHGFIVAHFAKGKDYNFQNFLRRALDKDCQVVVGVSIWNWMFSAVFIVFNAHGFYNHFWLPFIPLALLLLVGTKLQVIITKMCLERQNKGSVVVGTLLVKPDDKFFWFNRPKLLLHLMHFILFQNSFQLAFFTWTWYRFGLRSCFHRKTESIVIKMAVGLIVQFLCGYVTLPLYALVTQMGSSMKNVVFTDHVVLGLKNWQATAKEKLTRSNNNNLAASLSEPSSSNTRTKNSSGEEQEFEMKQFKSYNTSNWECSIEIVEERPDSKTSTS